MAKAHLWVDQPPVTSAARHPKIRGKLCDRELRLRWGVTMGNYDTASKHWVEHWPEAVLKVIMPGARFIGHQPTELPQVQRKTDRVMRVVEEAGGRELLLHVGIQTRSPGHEK